MGSFSALFVGKKYFEHSNFKLSYTLNYLYTLILLFSCIRYFDTLKLRLVVKTFAKKFLIHLIFSKVNF